MLATTLQWENHFSIHTRSLYFAMTTTKTYAVQIWKDLQLLILNISYANLAVRISDQVSATLT